MQQLSFRFHEERNVGGLEQSLQSVGGPGAASLRAKQALGRERGVAGANLAAEDSPAGRVRPVRFPHLAGPARSLFLGSASVSPSSSNTEPGSLQCPPSTTLDSEAHFSCCWLPPCSACHKKQRLGGAVGCAQEWSQREGRVWMPTLPLTGRMTLGTFLNLTELWLSQ